MGLVIQAPKHTTGHPQAASSQSCVGTSAASLSSGGSAAAGNTTFVPFFLNPQHHHCCRLCSGSPSAVRFGAADS